jgi:hypothetical protein
MPVSSHGLTPREVAARNVIGSKSPEVNEISGDEDPQSTAQGLGVDDKDLLI